MGGKLSGGGLDLGISYPARQLLGSLNSAAHRLLNLLVARKYRNFTRTASSKHGTARPCGSIFGFQRYAPLLKQDAFRLE